ncbi:MAG: hypothetical protein ABL995_09115 [Bryobacteraceae bacterium]
MRSDQELLDLLDARLKTLLPEEYQDCYEDVQPVSMGSAGLKFDAEGKVAWDEIWGSFCDLAMAGGPPHKGKLLEPATPAQIAEQPERYREVVDEICRGVGMVAYLPVEESPVAGWVRVDCERDVMADWLARAIVMENVSCYRDGRWIDLPAGPHYRLEKEIKNVITVIAKTCHYFVDHMWPGQQRQIAQLFAETKANAPLVQAAASGHGFDAQRNRALSHQIAEALRLSTGMLRTGPEYPGWLGLECSSVRKAISMMRGLVVHNVFSRREETVLFVPVNPADDPEGHFVVNAVTTLARLAAYRLP